MTVDELLAQYPEKLVSQIVNEDLKPVTDKLPAQFHASMFDLMTGNGYRLNLLTGDYEFRC